MKKTRRKLSKVSILLKNEELIKEKIQKYNHKQEILKKRQDQRHIKELETAVEENRKKEFRDKKLRESRTNYEKRLEENKIKLLTKIESYDERIKKQKEEQEQKKLKKYNKLFMQREDRKDRVMRYEKIKSYERRVKMEQINNRMENQNTEKNKNKENDICEELKKSIDTLILYRSLYILKKKFSSKKEIIKKL